MLTPPAKLTSDSLASMLFTLEWHSQAVHHIDGYFGDKVNLWRDFLPGHLTDQLIGKTIGETVSDQFPSGELVPAYTKGNIFNVLPSHFDQHFVPGLVTTPKIGRYYPAGMIQGIPGIFKETRSPCRCVSVEKDKLVFDFNHPLAKETLTVFVTIDNIWNKTREERGGRGTDWVNILMNQGVGLQAHHPDNVIDFFNSNSFIRLDNEDDGRFYQKPRLVSHLDSKAIEIITHLYSRLLNPDMQVLDLMSSWQSHLPTTLTLAKVTGLGMNQPELAQNPQLTDFVIHDLNQNPQLPFPNQSYDAVICTVSVEYLLQPYAVFKEVARVLRPQGLLVVTFSNRWFPPKVITLWHELHEFERLSLVLDYLFKAEAYHQFTTFSIHGYPRPEGDKYAKETSVSDPVFAVWGRKI